jgi:polysaccharide biosynthesis transport protein
MLQINKSSPPSNDEPVRQQVALGLDKAINSFTILRRQLPVFLILIPCATTLGLLYLLTTPSSYTAFARMVIDTRKVPAFQQEQVMGDMTTIDTAAVATQVQEAVQQQSFPISEARLITPAAPPSTRSHPNTLIVLAVTAAGGMMFAFGVAVLREASDRVFPTGAKIEDVLHVNCIATLPLLEPVAPNATDKQEDAAALSRIEGSDNLLHYVVDAPFSQFTELLRSLKVVADLSSVIEANRVIGVTSSLPEEGKSTIAANFAAMIAHAGSRVNLVDADLHKSSLSRNLSPRASAGLVEVAAGRTALIDAIWTDPTNGLTFLPPGPESTKLLHPNEILASVAIKSLIDKLRGAFDYVIVDFPPLAPVGDTRTTASFIDSYVYVVEWGRTKIDVVEHSLSNAREVYDRLLGVVLNKANMSVLQRYEPYRTNYYYRKYT